MTQETDVAICQPIGKSIQIMHHVEKGVRGISDYFGSRDCGMTGATVTGEPLSYLSFIKYR